MLRRPPKRIRFFCSLNVNNKPPFRQLWRAGGARAVDPAVSVGVTGVELQSRRAGNQVLALAMCYRLLKLQHISRMAPAWRIGHDMFTVSSHRFGRRIESAAGGNEAQAHDNEPHHLTNQ